MAAEALWHRISERAPADVAEAALELHWAAQVIAAAGQTFAEPADDDSHRSMTWHANLRAFVGAPFAGAYPLRIALRPEDLALLILDRTDESIAVLPLAGQTLDEAHEWLGLAVATYFGGAPPVLERPEYEMPSHPVENGARFSDRRTAERSVLSALYATAAEVLGEIAGAEAAASEVRCWPHHFDIATLMTERVNDRGDAEQTIGIGMAPSGGGCELWYWYVSPWPYPERTDLPALGRGEWHTEGWTGAVLTGEDTVAVPADSRADEVRAFLNEAISASREILAGSR